MALTLITGPVSEPITLAEAKTHLRVDGTDDDTYITTLITVVRERAENELRMSLMPQTWELVLDAFPDGEGAMQLPMRPVTAVSSVTYIDQSQVLQTLASTYYTLDTDSLTPWLLLAYGQTSWPLTLDVANAVRVRYAAGYANAAAVPASIKQWLLMAIGDLYETREAMNTAGQAAGLKFADCLLDRYRVVTFP